MTTALLVGHYNHYNLGDNALAAVAAWGAGTFFDADRVYATTAELPHIKGLRAKSLYYPWHIRGATRLNRIRESFVCRRSQTIILGGGSTVHSAEHIERYERMLDRAGAGPHFAAGVSIGPFRDSTAERACGRLLKRLDFVGVRDPLSHERAKDLAPDSRIELTFDLAPLLTPAFGEPHQDASDRSGLGIVLAHKPKVSGWTEREQPRIQRVADAILRCAARGIVNEVVLIDFALTRSDGAVRDRESHLELADALKGQVQIRHIPYSHDPLLAWKVIGKLQAVVGMRMHAAVVGYCEHVPTVVLAYDEKCYQWARMVGLPDSVVFDADNVDPAELATGIEHAMLGEDVAELPVEEAVQRARRNWDWARAERSVTLQPALRHG